MKKLFLLVPVAALAMTACTSESTESVGAGQQPKEIAFTPLAQPATRTTVQYAQDGTTFPTTNSMYVAAYDVTKATNFFEATKFDNSGEASTTTPTINKWTGGRFWPLSTTTINFLAYTGFNGTAGDEENGATWGSNYASQVQLVMTDNSTAQKDLMYACGTGTVTKTGNSVTYPEVPMSFKHAQAWITFNANTTSTCGGKVKLNSITLNGASYSGTYLVTHTGYDGSVAQSVSGVWSSLGAKGTVAGGDETAVAVQGWTPAAIAYASSGNGVAVGHGIMIVPDDTSTGDFRSFTINYSIEGSDATYDFEYTPASTNIAQNQHFIYNIVFNLHQIEIVPSVVDWTPDTEATVNIPE